MKIAPYDTDLTDRQWQLLEPLLPAAKKRGRPRTPLRAVCDAIFYMAKAGCPWRRLSTTFPPWKTVCHHFHQWSRNGLLGQLNTPLRAWARQAVVESLEQLAYFRGMPESITVDNGAEFCSRAVDAWAYAHGVKLDFIRPGKPVGERVHRELQREAAG